MNLTGRWANRLPQSAAARILFYGLTVTIVVLLGVAAFHYFGAKAADDCNKPAAPVVVPKAPPGLIVDAPCTDGSAPPKQPTTPDRR